MKSTKQFMDLCYSIIPYTGESSLTTDNEANAFTVSLSSLLKLSDSFKENESRLSECSKHGQYGTGKNNIKIKVHGQYGTGKNNIKIKVKSEK